MMKKRESGQAFILVIILLALGALLIGPALRLTSTTLLSSAVADQKTKELYAADAGQEYVMWKLLWQDYAGEFDAPNEEDQIEININGIPVTMTVVMRAVVGTGTTLFSDRFKIKPSKTVSYSTPNDGSVRDYTYTIKLENLTLQDQTLDCVYDILPKAFGTSNVYQSGSSQIRVDGGEWQALGNPALQTVASQLRLCWPSTYDYSTQTGGFSAPVRDFAPGQVKEIQFRVRGTLGNNKTYYDWVVLQPDAVASGPEPDGSDPDSAPDGAIVTGTGAGPVGGGVVVQKTALPQLATPGEVTDVKYDITITNLDENTLDVASVTDYLPPEFYYPRLPDPLAEPPRLADLTVAPPSGNLTTSDPSQNLGDYNGVDRWRLLWDNIPSANKSIASGGSKTLSFWARTTPNVSGAYYNEVVVSLANFPVSTIFSGIGITQENVSPFSWNSGVVIVPAYDSQAEAGDTTINANLGLTLGNISVISWVGQ